MNFVLHKLSRLDFSLPLNSILRHFMKILNETLDKFAPLQESRERKMAKPAWFNKGPKNFIGK